MAHMISISDQQNNSLGSCWLCKHEDDFTGELLDKCLYPKCDFSALDAIEAFIEGHVGEDEEYVDGIYLLDSAREDPEARSFAMTYKSRYGVEYRSMHTAIHHIIVFDDEESARRCMGLVKEAEENGDDIALWDEIGELGGYDIEVDFHDVEDLFLDSGECWRRYEDEEYGILLVNDVPYDLYV